MHEQTPFRLPLPAADQVSASKTSKIVLSTAYLFHSFTLLIGDTASATDAAILANIKEIRLKHGSTVLRQCTGAELNAMNARNGAQYGLVSNGAGAGTRKIWLTLYLAEMWRKSFAHQFASLLDARQLPDKLSIEVDFGAAAGVSLDGSFRASLDAYKQGEFIHWDRTDLALAGTSIDVPNFTVRGKLLSLDMANPAAGVLTKVILELDRVRKHESNDVDNTAELKGWDMNPQTGRYHLVMDYNDNIGNAPELNQKSEVKLHVECGAAMAPAPAIVEVSRPLQFAAAA